MKPLKQQLLEFAARKVVAKAVDIAAYEGINAVKKGMRQRNAAAPLNTNNDKQRKYHMSFKDSAAFGGSTTRNQETPSGARTPREPVDFWVNTVMVMKKGDRPVRVFPGRPLKSFSDNRDVNTNNEEFNEDNIMNNSMVKILREDAEKLDLGESRYYGATGSPKPVDDQGTLEFQPGIYFELRRSENDPAEEAAIKADREAETTESLRNIFG